MSKSPLAFLGAFRLFLAVSVVICHFWVSIAPDAGRHAVIAFFCISGFLITKIARENYAGRPVAFIKNRFLRIYPLYFFAIAFGAMTIALLPDVAFALNALFEKPQWPMGFVQQILLVGIDKAPTRLSPPAWSLSIEIVFYALIGLVTYRSRLLTWVLFVASIVIFTVADITFYNSIIGSAFAFFLGSLACFYKDKIQLSSMVFYAALALFILNAFAMPFLIPRNIAVALSAAITAVLLLSGKNITQQNFDFLGKLSYPLFLLHWAVGVYVSLFLKMDSFAFFITALCLTLSLSTALVIMLEPLERIRSKIRAFNSRPT
ncbi:MAG: acyltransferase [Alphaproteobacteria bacterium]|nr:acyltransferase [Alphaproteobacteria bacterium]